MPRNGSSTNDAARMRYSHAFKLLELIDPGKVRKAAPNCERMFSVILGKLR